jgi:type IV pilus assembly protein PilY1
MNKGRHNMNKLNLSRMVFLAVCLLSTQTNATNLSVADAPLYTVQDVPPMMMLVMGRDHTLYYEAYNDASDLDDDGDLDIKFTPSISYEGYFDPDKCYSYDSGLFSPDNVAATCSGLWSGNFLNYLTMTRMDVLRKVLYGGYRSTDSTTSTILERSFIPQDAHSWAKAYTSEDIDGYDIADYTPFSVPNSGEQHFFGSVTYTSTTSVPVLRVRQNVSYTSSDWGVWSWASTERPVLNASGTDYTVRVSVCNPDLLEDNCKEYIDGTNTSYKPTGLLHDYGEDDSMLFGLISGSFNGNLSGGVLRQAISQFSNEINSTTGQFVSDSLGIVATINKFRIHGFRYSDKAYQTNCGWIDSRAITEGECASWGNPVGEMLYESLRYFSGEGSASSSFDKAGDYDTSLGLTTATWDDPYDGRDYCTQASNLLISDINPSYDSDQLPGSNVFVGTDGVSNDSGDKTYSGTTLTGFNLTDLLTTISSEEGLTSGQYFIGQSGNDNDGAPTAKEIAGLSTIRGLTPNEPTKKGSYSSAGVAYYGMAKDLRSDLSDDGYVQNVTTSVVSLASPLPEVEVTVDGQTVKILPFAKTVRGTTVYPTTTNFQPTNTIVDWYVQSLTDTSGVFRINFEDVEQGADHDMDMIVKYSYEVESCTVVNCGSYTGAQRLKIDLDSTYAAGGYNQHAGYIISGTTNDGLYLEVKDQSGGDVYYYLDTPISSSYENRDELSDYSTKLTLAATRYFYPSSDNAASFLDSPLQFAAKWGNFTDGDDNDGKPSTDSEWDSDGDGLPDAYFPVTNAGELSAQLAEAFNSIFTAGASATSPVFSSTFLESGTYLYSSSFENEFWSGDILAYPVNDDGTFSSTSTWSAADELDARTADSRTIYTRSDATDDVFEFTTDSTIFDSKANFKTYVNGTSDNDNSFSIDQITSLIGSFSGNYNKKWKYTKALIDYLRGDRTNESLDDDSIYQMRERNSKLGDVINSTPYYVSETNGHTVGKDLIVFGANDGMVHILNADTGAEIMAYIPSGVYDELNDLAQTTYSHKFIVDGGISAYSSEDTVPVTMLVGTLGRSLGGVYAIDVSDMTTPAASMMKWEITSDTSGYEGLGNTASAPTIAKLHTLQSGENRVGVVFANGYNSSVNDGVIYIADIDDGSLIKTLTTGTVVDPSGNNWPDAMASPTVIDLDADGIADRIYAGDLYGNMWVFDITDEDTSNWGNAITGDLPLFTAKSPTTVSDTDLTYRSQSITSHAAVGAHPNGVDEGVLVAFGTGKYIESGDSSVTDQATQSFYVIWDKLNGNQVLGTASPSSAAARSLTNNNQYDGLLMQEIELEYDSHRYLSENEINWDTDSGFYLDLINTASDSLGNLGERQVTDSLLSVNKVTFTTLIPDDDPCVAGGTSWYMVMDIFTGQSWNNGSYTIDESTGVVTIVEESTNVLLDGIATGASSVINVTNSENENDDDESVTVESTIPELTETTCVTLAGGTTQCFEGDSAPTGRLTWQQLY